MIASERSCYTLGMIKYKRIVLLVIAGIFLLSGCSSESTAPEPSLENATLPPPAITNVPPATEEVAVVPPTVALVVVEPTTETPPTETTLDPSPIPPTIPPAPTAPPSNNLYPDPDLTLIGTTGRPQFLQSYANW
jgi:outer membrane biosynthesis protein TonB